MTLRNVLLRRMRKLDRERATKLVLAGGVYINRLRVRLPQVRVAPGERITVYPEALDAEPLDPQSLSFVLRSEDFVILDKPPGVPVTPRRETAVGCLSEALIHRLEAEGVTRPYVGVVHRLDRGASGLVLFTIRDIANKSLHKQFVEHSVRRRYRVRVRGQAPEAITCDAALVERKSGVAIADAGDPNAQSARTHFRRLARFEDVGEDLLEAELETGRTHQIRAHAAHLGFPVVGDHRYGPSPETSAEAGRGEREIEPLRLHAYRLDFEHPLSGEAVSAESALPDWATTP
nr:RluA family pseudouridine synthase [Pseudenhygromyxa sp. WMMC2535]